MRILTVSRGGIVSAAGIGNTVSAEASFIGGGLYGLVTGGGSFIGAGDSLYNNACECTTVGNSVSGADSFIGAGDQNTIAANGAFVGSGDLNDVTSAAAYSVVAGGYGNTMSGQKATLGGGEQNNVAGSFATIPGGYRNEALGNESFAAGSQAEARYAGRFVWSDYVSVKRRSEIRQPVSSSPAHRAASTFFRMRHRVQACISPRGPERGRV